MVSNHYDAPQPVMLQSPTGQTTLVPPPTKTTAGTTLQAPTTAQPTTQATTQTAPGQLPQPGYTPPPPQQLQPPSSVTTQPPVTTQPAPQPTAPAPAKYTPQWAAANGYTYVADPTQPGVGSWQAPKATVDAGNAALAASLGVGGPALAAQAGYGVNPGTDALRAAGYQLGPSTDGQPHLIKDGVPLSPAQSQQIVAQTNASLDPSAGGFQTAEGKPWDGSYTPTPVGPGGAAGAPAGAPPPPQMGGPGGGTLVGGGGVGGTQGGGYGPPPMPSAAGALVQQITGNETPYSVLPQESQGLTGLTQAIQSAAQKQLDHPGMLDTDLFNQASDLARQRLDEQYGTAENALKANLAKRGLDYSSVAAGNLSDLATEKGRAFQQMLLPLLQDAANQGASSRQAAMNNALGAAGFQNAVESGNRNELRTERGYLDQLDSQAHDQALQEYLAGQGIDQANQGQFQQVLQQALGYGYQQPGTAGDQALVQLGQLYGAQNAQQNDQLGQLSNAALQFLLAGRG